MAISNLEEKKVLDRLLLFVRGGGVVKCDAVRTSQGVYILGSPM